MNKQGQILPFCMLLVAGVLLIMFSNFKIGFLNLRKIQAQKKIDAVALDYGTQYARALNALAAINDGLTIASQRGYMMATVAATLAACAAPKFSPCEPPWELLKPRLPTFYKNLNKLGQELVRQQEQIIAWMISTRCSKPELNDFYLYPTFPCINHHGFDGLPFYRPSNNLLGIPAPLIFKKEFFEDKNKIIMIHSLPEETVYKVWAISEVKIVGDHFKKMEFSPRLTAISLENQLWAALNSEKPFQTWPSLTTVKNEIVH